MTSLRTLVLTALTSVFALALGACSSSTTPPEDTPDTTAPVVSSSIPSNGQVGVPTNALITVSFNEAMAPASATGQVTLSSGGIATVNWLTDRSFTVSHSQPWAEGVPVSVTLGVGLTDAAGNALAAPYVFSFFTETSALLLVASDPADNATAVSRSASVRLQFSLQVDQTSLESGVTISEAGGKVGIPFTVSGGSGNWYTLDPTVTLPASTLITVTIGATVHVQGSPLNTLGSAVVRRFTTGVDVDTTPPTIVSVSPANGTTNVPADVGAMVIRFSEAIETDTLNPYSWNVEFALALMTGGNEPIWSEGNTVLTVALPSPLPAGMEMAIAFAGFTDTSGNPQNTAYEWSARIAGTADIYPMADGIRHYLDGVWSEGVAGSSTPTDYGDRSEYRQVEVQPNNDVHLVGYEEDTFATPRRWDAYRRSASVINWLGFADGDNGGTPQAILFDTALKYLPLPMAAGTWTGSTTVTVPGEGTYSAVMNGRVVGREDLVLDAKSLPSSLKSAPAGIYYKGAWKVVRTLEVTLGGQWFTTMADTTWYSPTTGPVREITHEDHAARDQDPAGWYRTDSWRDPTGGLSLK